LKLKVCKLLKILSSKFECRQCASLLASFRLQLKLFAVQSSICRNYQSPQSFLLLKIVIAPPYLLVSSSQESKTGEMPNRCGAIALDECDRASPLFFGLKAGLGHLR
jgi:hypothetical protein